MGLPPMPHSTPISGRPESSSLKRELPFWPATSAARAGSVSAAQHIIQAPPGPAALWPDSPARCRVREQSEAAPGALSGSTAAGVVATVLAQLLSQARTTFVQRGTDIPGRPLGGGQATDDRNDRAVLPSHFACFDEVPGIFGRLLLARLLLA